MPKKKRRRYSPQKQEQYRLTNGRLCIKQEVLPFCDSTYVVWHEPVGGISNYVWLSGNLVKAKRFARKYAVENQLAFNVNKDVEVYKEA